MNKFNCLYCLHDHDWIGTSTCHPEWKMEMKIVGDDGTCCRHLKLSTIWGCSSVNEFNLWRKGRGIEPVTVETEQEHQERLKNG